MTDRIEYSPYGTTTYRSGTNDTPFLFNGRYGVQTDANGLLYMRARYYNPHLCRFINADPSGFEGGLNHYAYADGNPISLIDPFGLGAANADGGGSWITRAWGAVRAVGGGVMAAVGYTLGTVTAPTVVGAILGGTIASFGIDQMQAGARQAWTGQDTQTMLNNSLRAAGMSPNAAAITEGSLNILAAGGAGYYSTVNSVPKVVATTTIADTQISIGNQPVLVAITQNGGVIHNPNLALGHAQFAERALGITGTQLPQGVWIGTAVKAYNGQIIGLNSMTFFNNQAPANPAVQTALQNALK